MLELADSLHTHGLHTLPLRLRRPELWKLRALLDFPADGQTGVLAVAHLPTSSDADVGHFVLLLTGRLSSVVMFDVSVGTVKEVPFDLLPETEFPVLLVSDSVDRVSPTTLRNRSLRSAASEYSWHFTVGLVLLGACVLLASFWRAIPTACASLPTTLLKCWSHIRRQAPVALIGTSVIAAAWVAIVASLEHPAGALDIRPRPAALNAGRLDVGSIEKFSFRLHNSGDSTAEIARITSTCACIDVKCDATHIEPGADVECAGSLRGIGIGAQKQLVRFQLRRNDRIQSVAVSIEYEGRFGLRVVPNRVALGVFSPGSHRQQEMAFQFEHLTGEAHIEEVRLLESTYALSARLVDGKRLKEGEEFTLVFTIPPEVSLGRLSSKFAVEGTIIPEKDAEPKAFSKLIEVHGTVVPALRAQPTSVFLTAEKSNQVEEIRLYRTRADIEIRDASCDIPGVRAEVNAEATTPQMIALRVYADIPNETSSRTGKLIIRTANDGANDLTLPVVIAPAN